MTDRKTAIVDDQAIGKEERAGTGQASPAPGKQTYISGQRRAQDALEDDEVREALRARHAPGPCGTGIADSGGQQAAQNQS
jgi:hypothetical protein